MSENLLKAQEEQLAIARDFQTTFSSSGGQRTLAFLMDEILKANAVAGPGGADRACYIVALHDAAIQIRKLLNLSFAETRPTVAPRPKFTGRASVPAGMRE